MPSPSDYFNAQQIELHKYIIEEKRENIFAPNASGGCRVDADIIVFGNRNLCIYWQKNGQPVQYKRILLALGWIERYIRFGGFCMDYDSTALPIKTHTGADGIKRKWIIEANTELCRGYGGAAYNGRSWCAITQSNLNDLINTSEQARPTMPQVLFYEMGRGLWDLKFDKIWDWELDQPQHYGFWTLGFNGAMTCLAPEFIGANMNYYGQDAAGFRADRLNDLNTYVRSRRYNFENTWCAYLLPWNSSQSVNDLMSGLIIQLYESYGGPAFMHLFAKHLKDQPDTYTRQERERRAENMVRAVVLAVNDLYGMTKAVEAHQYFYATLRWTFLGPFPDPL